MTKRIEKAAPQSSALASSKRAGGRAEPIGNRMRCRAAIAYGFGLSLLLAASPISHADKVDDVVSAEMQKHHITGLSLAIIEKGDIASAKGYGFTDQGGKVPVTISTLFQAGSVSKPVAALGALYLVEQGRRYISLKTGTAQPGFVSGSLQAIVLKGASLSERAVCFASTLGYFVCAR